MQKEVFIVAAKRTSIGSFGGNLSSLSAPKLGAEAIKAVLKESNVDINTIDEVLMGNVLQANVGQAPARQAAIFAGISHQVPCTTVNKVCASGMKSIMMAAQSIIAGDNHTMIAGGMENMSMVPYYLEGVRSGYKLGDQKLIDGLVKDGLTDVYNQYHMGNAAELCAKEHGISREQQDAYAIESYRRSTRAWENGMFALEVVPIEIPQRNAEALIVNRDEEYSKANIAKIPNLKPVFQKEGTVTAANASTLNDGAAALILASKETIDTQKLKPLARIVGYADAAHKPEWFTTAPSTAINKLLEKTGKKISDIDYFELNEAFSVVSLANMKLTGIDPSKININGGAVSLGHPLGCSGARIVVTLLSVLKQKGGKYGVAAICNGGGGASAIMVELL